MTDQEIAIDDIVTDIIAHCESSDGGKISAEERHRIFARRGQLKQRRVPVGHHSRGAYTGECRVIQGLVQRELARRGLTLILLQRHTKSQGSVHQLTDAAMASVIRVRDEPAMLPKRAKRLIASMRRFFEQPGQTFTNLPADKRKILLTLLQEEHDDAARGLQRRVDFAFEISGIAPKILPGSIA
jgi:hypothetical protein